MHANGNKTKENKGKRRNYKIDGKEEGVHNILLQQETSKYIDVKMMWYDVKINVVWCKA